MKKLFFISAIFIASSFVNAQKEVRQVLAQGKNSLDWKINQLIKDDDTTIYFYYGFQNREYQYITDIGSIFVTSKSELEILGKKLIEYGSIVDKVSQTELVGDVRLEFYDFSHLLYVYDRNKKYTNLTKKEAIKLGNEMIQNSHYLKD